MRASWQQKINGLMRSDRNMKGLSPLMMKMASRAYGGALFLRKIGYERRLLKQETLSCPVISIGNITVGGTGKTPFTIFMAKLLLRERIRVAIVSRGYRGEAEKAGGIVSTGEMLLMDAKQAGDEPLMMAQELPGVPVVVGSHRARAGRIAIQAFHPEVILLDDGFQHQRLFRDMDIVLLDTLSPFGNGSLLPRGTLREPIPGLSRGDIFIFTRSELADQERKNRSLEALSRIVPGKPVFHGVHEPYIKRLTGETAKRFPSLDPVFFMERKVALFSGIADNEGFRQRLIQWGARPVAFFPFRDHHAFTRKEIEEMKLEARRSGAEFMVTTEKDYVRLPLNDRSAMDLAVVDVRISLGEALDRFSTLILPTIRKLIQIKGASKSI